MAFSRHPVLYGLLALTLLLVLPSCTSQTPPPRPPGRGLLIATRARGSPSSTRDTSIPEAESEPVPELRGEGRRPSGGMPLPELPLAGPEARSGPSEGGPTPSTISDAPPPMRPNMGTGDMGGTGGMGGQMGGNGGMGGPTGGIDNGLGDLIGQIIGAMGGHMGGQMGGQMGGMGGQMGGMGGQMGGMGGQMGGMGGQMGGMGGQMGGMGGQMGGMGGQMGGMGGQMGGMGGQMGGMGGQMGGMGGQMGGMGGQMGGMGGQMGGMGGQMDGQMGGMDGQMGGLMNIPILDMMEELMAFFEGKMGMDGNMGQMEGGWGNDMSMPGQMLNKVMRMRPQFGLAFMHGMGMGMGLRMMGPPPKQRPPPPRPNNNNTDGYEHWAQLCRVVKDDETVLVNSDCPPEHMCVMMEKRTHQCDDTSISVCLPDRCYGMSEKGTLNCMASNMNSLAAANRVSVVDQVNHEMALWMRTMPGQQQRAVEHVYLKCLAPKKDEKTDFTKAIPLIGSVVEVESGRMVFNHTCMPDHINFPHPMSECPMLNVSVCIHKDCAAKHVIEDRKNCMISKIRARATKNYIDFESQAMGEMEMWKRNLTQPQRDMAMRVMDQCLMPEMKKIEEMMKPKGGKTEDYEHWAQLCSVVKNGTGDLVTSRCPANYACVMMDKSQHQCKQTAISVCIPNQCYGMPEKATLDCMARIMNTQAAANRVSVEEQVMKNMTMWMRTMSMEQQRNAEHVYATCFAHTGGKDDQDYEHWAQLCSVVKDDRDVLVNSRCPANHTCVMMDKNQHQCDTTSISVCIPNQCYGMPEKATLDCMARIMNTQAAANRVSVEEQVMKNMTMWMRTMSMEQQHNAEYVYATCFAPTGGKDNAKSDFMNAIPLIASAVDLRSGRMLFNHGCMEDHVNISHAMRACTTMDVNICMHKDCAAKTNKEEMKDCMIYKVKERADKNRVNMESQAKREMEMWKQGMTQPQRDMAMRIMDGCVLPEMNMLEQEMKSGGGDDNKGVSSAESYAQLCHVVKGDRNVLVNSSCLPNHTCVALHVNQLQCDNTSVSVCIHNRCYGMSETDTLACMPRVMRERAAADRLTVEEQVQRDMMTWMEGMSEQQQNTIGDIYNKCFEMEKNTDNSSEGKILPKMEHFAPLCGVVKESSNILINSSCPSNHTCVTTEKNMHFCGDSTSIHVCIPNRCYGLSEKGTLDCIARVMNARAAANRVSVENQVQNDMMRFMRTMSLEQQSTAQYVYSTCFGFTMEGKDDKEVKVESTEGKDNDDDKDDDSNEDIVVSPMRISEVVDRTSSRAMFNVACMADHVKMTMPQDKCETVAIKVCVHKDCRSKSNMAAMQGCMNTMLAERARASRTDTESMAEMETREWNSRIPRSMQIMAERVRLGCLSP